MGTLNTRINADCHNLFAFRELKESIIFTYIFLERDLKTQKYVLGGLQRTLLQFYCKFMRYVFLAVSIVNANTHI